MDIPGNGNDATFKAKKLPNQAVANDAEEEVQRGTGTDYERNVIAGSRNV